MKFYYFNVHGHGDCIRMAIWKAGVQYEDVRLAGPSWMEAKNSVIVEIGQIKLMMWKLWETFPHFKRWKKYQRHHFK